MSYKQLLSTFFYKQNLKKSLLWLLFGCSLLTTGVYAKGNPTTSNNNSKNGEIAADAAILFLNDNKKRDQFIAACNAETIDGIKELLDGIAKPTDVQKQIIKKYQDKFKNNNAEKNDNDVKLDDLLKNEFFAGNISALQLTDKTLRDFLDKVSKELVYFLLKCSEEYLTSLGLSKRDLCSIQSFMKGSGDQANVTLASFVKVVLLGSKCNQDEILSASYSINEQTISHANNEIQSYEDITRLGKEPTDSIKTLITGYALLEKMPAILECFVCMFGECSLDTEFIDFIEKFNIEELLDKMNSFAADQNYKDGLLVQFDRLLARHATEENGTQLNKFLEEHYTDATIAKLKNFFEEFRNKNISKALSKLLELIDNDTFWGDKKKIELGNDNIAFFAANEDIISYLQKASLENIEEQQEGYRRQLLTQVAKKHETAQFLLDLCGEDQLKAAGLDVGALQAVADSKGDVANLIDKTNLNGLTLHRVIFIDKNSLPESGIMNQDTLNALCVQADQQVRDAVPSGTSSADSLGSLLKRVVALVTGGALLSSNVAPTGGYLPGAHGKGHHFVSGGGNFTQAVSKASRWRNVALATAAAGAGYGLYKYLTKEKKAIATPANSGGMQKNWMFFLFLLILGGLLLVGHFYRKRTTRT